MNLWNAWSELILTIMLIPIVITSPIMKNRWWYIDHMGLYWFLNFTVFAAMIGLVVALTGASIQTSVIGGIGGSLVLTPVAFFTLLASCDH
jgi:hypothetical protein